MNLFRSEEDVLAWSDFDSKTAKQIKSVQEWAQMFQGGRLFQKRLDDDFVENSEEYANEALGGLADALS